MVGNGREGRERKGFKGGEGIVRGRLENMWDSEGRVGELVHVL
jgi:hypothetical protein